MVGSYRGINGSNVHTIVRTMKCTVVLGLTGNQPIKSPICLDPTADKILTKLYLIVYTMVYTTVCTTVHTIIYTAYFCLILV